MTTEQHMATRPGTWDEMCGCRWLKLVLQAVGKAGLEVGRGIVCLPGQEIESESGGRNMEEGN